MVSTVSLAVALLQITPSTPLPVIVHRLNERLPKFSIAASGLNVIEARLNRVLGNGKIPKEPYNNPVQIQEGAIARVRGEPAVVLTLVADPMARTALLLLEQRGTRAQVSVLKDGDDELAPWPTAAVRYGGDLVVAGATQWFGNGPSGSISVFRKSNGAWTEVQAARTESQDVFDSHLLFDKEKRGPLVIVLNGRTYPTHLNACHAMAIVHMQERWKYYNNKLAIISRLRVPTPFAALDDLAGALALRDRTKVSALCASPSVASAAWAMRQKISGDEAPGVWVTGNVCDWKRTEFHFTDLPQVFSFTKHNEKWLLAQIRTARNSQRD